jgi:hypothetical protein
MAAQHWQIDCGLPSGKAAEYEDSTPPAFEGKNYLKSFLQEQACDPL